MLSRVTILFCIIIISILVCICLNILRYIYNDRTKEKEYYAIHALTIVMLTIYCVPFLHNLIYEL